MWIISKSHCEKFLWGFWIFLQSPHQVDMKNIVKCYKHFFGYFNALKTHGVGLSLWPVTIFDHLFRWINEIDVWFYWVLKTDWKRKFLYKWPLYDLFWPFFCHVCVYLSQKWGSDGHFELLNGSESWFGQKLWPQM